MMEKSHYAGYLLLMCYDVGVQAHFLVTVNRFCAVFMPMVYRSLFSAKLTKRVVFTSFLISFTTLTIFFQFLPCRCYYSEEDLSFIFDDYPICWDYDAIDAIKVTFLGVTCNGLVVLAILTNRTLNHSFLILTGNQAIFYWIFGMVYAIYIIPMLVFAKLTKLIVLTSFLISITILTIFFQFLPCRCYYSEEALGFTYKDNPICWDYATVNTVKILTMCIFNVVVDTITIWKVRRIRSAQGVTKIQKKEIDFLKQSFGQALFLFISIPALYIVPLFTTTPLAKFVMRTLFWASTYAVDGALTLYFNVEIRKSLATQFKLNKGVSGPTQGIIGLL
ncbi:hypothetical protein GCK72_017078 [Caenorhabditis remanei]|uniref:7TM GPCR serpentine receptor class x (Srx) domain-containing protein n=1 Tax=Caenorhabditis remanei TaxID=31234 RepID=A0A6A5G653_CAERE|nr:hypothetical protein GCK72_017078 [Caenorhabditis remanei]KAF1750528.1 hypothetical protein GCK72_017078 [Caenorhabditis remanei]